MEQDRTVRGEGRAEGDVVAGMNDVCVQGVVGGSGDFTTH